MRILCLNHEYPPIGGGSGVATKHLAEALVSIGHEVLVIAPADREEQSEEGGLSVRRFPIVMSTGKLAGVKNWLSFLRRAPQALRKAIADFRPEVIHSHFLFPSAYVVSGCKTGLPHVASIVGADIFDPTRRVSAENNLLVRMLIRRALQRVDRVTSSCADLTQRAQRLFPWTQITRIPWGVPPLINASPGYQKADPPANKLRITTVCRLVRRKRVDLLLNAVAKLNDPAIYLVIMGDGPLRDELQQLARDLGITAQVDFPGEVSESDKIAYLSNADLFCLASDHEGFGLVFVEAMSLGVPVITTNLGGQTEIVRDGVDGFLIPCGDSQALADRIQTLQQHPELLVQMKASAQERARLFAPEVVARQFEDVFLQAISEYEHQASG